MKLKVFLKRLLFIVPVIVAIVFVGLMLKNKQQPSRLPPVEKSYAVRVIEIPQLEVTPRAIGYGLVEPSQEWQMVPEVSGKIIEVSPLFKKGNFVHADQVLIKIDPTDYQLSVEQCESEIKSIKANLAELERNEQNYKSLLTIQKKLLKLKNKELKRNLNARKKSSVSESAYDQAQMDYQNQLLKVQELENSLRLIPTSRQELKASLELALAKLKEAQINLERTHIKAPFDCRMISTEAELGQFVPQGQVIALADGTSQVEITAQIPMEKMPALLSAVTLPPLTASMDTIDRLKMDNIKKLLGLQAQVTLANGSFEATWPADFARADASIDDQTRTVGIIVVVPDPYQKIIIGKRPPLVRNMFCKVIISGRPLAGQMVIPRSALHGDYVYIMDTNNRLQLKKIKIKFKQQDFVVVKSGVQPGQKIIISELSPAIEGMLLRPVDDKQALKELQDQAAGSYLFESASEG